MHTACCAESEKPENDKTYFKSLLEWVHGLSIKFRTVLADAQYSSNKVRAATEEFGTEPVIPVKRDCKVKDALSVGRVLRDSGATPPGGAVQGRCSVERLFSRAKEWVLLGCLKLRGS